MNIIQNIWYFLKLTVSTEIAWVVLPLFLATIVMIFYFEKYKEEKPGWNTHVANSLVLLFVSVILFQQIYNLNNAGIINFINYLDKFIVSLFVLFIGIIILFLNFERIIPEKIARFLSSPLTLNLLVYMVIIYVYSETKNKCEILFSLLIFFLLLLLLLSLIKIPARKLFLSLKKMKEKEKIENILYERKRINAMKKDVKTEEKKIKKEKIKELDKQKKEAIKLKKLTNILFVLFFGAIIILSVIISVTQLKTDSIIHSNVIKEIYDSELKIPSLLILAAFLFLIFFFKYLSKHPKKKKTN